MGALLLALIYVCFISLGLPDSLLGSAWPVLHQEIAVPVSFAGIISIIICAGTTLSSLFADWLGRRFGTAAVTAVSVTMTAVALFGFSISTQFWMLVVWSIPYGLGAGGVDALLNNYVALHYKPQHMSWLHCFWGIGASVSPYIMSFSLVRLNDWSIGYLLVSIVQIAISAIVFASLPLWKKHMPKTQDAEEGKPLSAKEIFTTPGAVFGYILFFGYGALELSATLWASSYLVEARGVTPEIASAFASLVYIGITVGRGINGFLAMRLDDHALIRMGLGMVSVGVLCILLPLPTVMAFIGFVVVGLGCAPIYPCIIHMTPKVFGEERSRSMLGVQMAAGNLGFLLVPPLVGVIAEKFGVALLPVCLAIFTVCMIAMHELLCYQTKGAEDHGS